MRACVIDDCDGQVFGHDMCQKHYHRVRRHGDPHHVTARSDARRPGPAERLAKRTQRVGDCLLYTGGHEARSGHVQFWLNGAMIGVHRAAWILAHGDPGDLVVRHQCDTPRCVELTHLELGTVADNNRDRDERNRHVALRGEDNGIAKLTEESVGQIIEMLADGVAQAKVAERFGVSQRAIWAVAVGQTWAHVPRPRSANGATYNRRALTSEQVAEAIERHLAGESGASIARSFGVGASAISYHVVRYRRRQYADPVDNVPQVNLKALEKVEWPALTEGVPTL